MANIQNGPVRPPLKPLHQPPGFGKAVPAPSGDGRAARNRAACEPSESFTNAKQIALHAAAEIRRQFGDSFTRAECQRLANAFRSVIVTKRKPGRRQKEQITAALADWRKGARGDDLCRAHVPGWEKHSEWRRKHEKRVLMEGIRTRRRRERAKAKSIGYTCV